MRSLVEVLFASESKTNAKNSIGCFSLTRNYLSTYSSLFEKEHVDFEVEFNWGAGERTNI